MMADGKTLTLTERARVAAATGATVTLSGADCLALCRSASVAREIRANLHAAQQTVDYALAETRRVEAAARQLLGAAIVCLGIGLGALIAGLIL